MLKILSGILCSSLLSAGVSTWVDRSLSMPYPYFAATRNSADTDPICFAGLAGTPGGIDLQLIPLAQELSLDMRQIFFKNSRLLPAFNQLMNHIRFYGGPSKDFIIRQMHVALSSNAATPFMFIIATLQGMRPARINPKTIIFLEHTIIRDEFKIWRERNFTRSATRQTLLPNTFETDNISHVSIIPYFGGIFGITTHLEMFCKRLSIIGIPTQSYPAHGYTLDPFSAIMHDIVHANQAMLLDDILKSVTIFLRDQCLAIGISAQRFKTLEQNTLYQEQTRFLNMILCLNSEAFRRWGLSQTYRKFALGLFLMTHEIISFTPEMIVSTDFIGSFSRMIDIHLNLLQIMPILSPKDILQTDPKTGVSKLTHTEIKDIMIKKYFKETNRNRIRTALVTLNDGDFYDLNVELTNGEKLFFTEPTFAFKRKNYADTRNLMRIAGILIPEIQQSDSEENVEFLLQLGIYAWAAVMMDLKEKVAYLAETTIDRSGRSLSRVFFDERFKNLEALTARLQCA